MNGDAECKLGTYCNRISSIFKIFDPRENLFSLEKMLLGSEKTIIFMYLVSIYELWMIATKSSTSTNKYLFRWRMGVSNRQSRR